MVDMNKLIIISYDCGNVLIAISGMKVIYTNVHLKRSRMMGKDNNVPQTICSTSRLLPFKNRAMRKTTIAILKAGYNR
jgi:hypothetical protein